MFGLYVLNGNNMASLHHVCHWLRPPWSDAWDGITWDKRNVYSNLKNVIVIIIYGYLLFSIVIYYYLSLSIFVYYYPSMIYCYGNRSILTFSMG